MRYNAVVAVGRRSSVWFLLSLATPTFASPISAYEAFVTPYANVASIPSVRPYDNDTFNTYFADWDRWQTYHATTGSYSTSMADTVGGRDIPGVDLYAQARVDSVLFESDTLFQLDLTLTAEAFASIETGPFPEELLNLRAMARAAIGGPGPPWFSFTVSEDVIYTGPTALRSVSWYSDTPFLSGSVLTPGTYELIQRPTLSITTDWIGAGETHYVSASRTSSYRFVQVPEPATFSLFGAGLLTIVFIQRRRRHLP